MYTAQEFCTLAVRRISRGNWVKLMCLRPTADFYGWSSVFPDWIDAQFTDYPGNIRPMPIGVGYRGYRGMRLRICRHKTKRQGHPAGLTNCFRVTNNASNMDLYAIAQAVGIDYGWMEAKNGYRRPKAEWDSFDLPDQYCHLDLRAADCLA